MSRSGYSKDCGSSLFKPIFEFANIGIVITDRKGMITEINPYLLKELGYTKRELTGKGIEILLAPGFRERHHRYHEKFTERPQNRLMGSGLDLHALKKDGSEFPAEISLSSFRVGKEMFVVAFLSNISTRKKAELEIKVLNDELESMVKKRTLELTDAMQQLETSKEELSRMLKREKELGEMKSKFVSLASHEFRTPLSTVLSSAYLAENYNTTEDQGKRKKHLGRIVSSVRLMTDILDDFLSVGKIEEGQIRSRPELFNICDLMELLKEEEEPSLKKGQGLDYIHTGDCIVTLDPLLIKNITLNLLSNAIKFSPEDSDILISTECFTDIMILTVKDHGIGISKNDQEHLMERFFRGSNANHIKGTGLGLHIVSKYAELMNGTVQCCSELGKGTEFKVSFNYKNQGL